jgi:hypothetical protein
MSHPYELALKCHVRVDVSKDVIDTLTYMTRSAYTENSGFQTKLKHDLFTSLWDPGSFEDSEDEAAMFLDEWRVIIVNELEYDEELLSEWYGVRFQDRHLEVRKMIHDDTFSNCSYLLFNWLASICESTGEVGYFHSLFNYQRDYYKPVPIYFIDGKAYANEEEGRIEF